MPYPMMKGQLTFQVANALAIVQCTYPTLEKSVVGVDV